MSAARVLQKFCLVERLTITVQAPESHLSMSKVNVLVYAPIHICFCYARSSTAQLVEQGTLKKTRPNTQGAYINIYTGSICI